MTNNNLDDKIYYTEDIINEMVLKGYDYKLVEDFLKFYITFLRKKVSTTDEVAFYIPNFGTIYMTITGANYTLKEIEKLQKNPILNQESISKRHEVFSRKKDKLKYYISKLKELNVKKIAYFDKIWNPKYIKNA